MSTAANALKELHQLHLKRKAVQDSTDRGPLHIKARQQMVEKKLAEAEAYKDKLQQLRMTADNKSLHLKTNEGKITDLKGKLNAASSNREFDVIKTQVEADQMANSVLEDEILEVLDKVDQAQLHLKELQQAAETAKLDQKRIAEEFAASEPELRRQAEELDAAIRDAEACLPGSISLDYRRLVKAYGPAALAPIVNFACTSCYVQLSPQYRVDIRSGKTIFCSTCGRLLYIPDEA